MDGWIDGGTFLLALRAQLVDGDGQHIGVWSWLFFASSYFSPLHPNRLVGLEKSLLILDCHCRPEIKTKAPLYSYYSLCVCVQSKVFVLGFESWDCGDGDRVRRGWRGGADHKSHRRIINGACRVDQTTTTITISWLLFSPSILPQLNWPTRIPSIPSQGEAPIDDPLLGVVASRRRSWRMTRSSGDDCRDRVFVYLSICVWPFARWYQ